MTVYLNCDIDYKCRPPKAECPTPSSVRRLVKCCERCPIGESIFIALEDRKIAIKCNDGIVSCQERKIIDALKL